VKIRSRIDAILACHASPRDADPIGRQA